ncbi:MAG: 2-C-methyl-D-erythritol 2,4-cyclodiphosphate synthase [Flavobacteriales bacterium]
MIPRIGFGYDVHRSTAGEKIRLGGVDVPAPFSLEAHSDGDVLIHALIDALLGAMGDGDIGTHFPDDDPNYQNVPGTHLLQKTLKRVEKNGYSFGNLDATILAEEPKLKGYIPSMKKELAKALDVSDETLSLKATTHEKLGPIGDSQGVAVHAVVLLFPSDARV